MTDYIKNELQRLCSMDSKERNVLLLQLSAKEYLGTASAEEIMQISIIQSIRQANGEIQRVLDNWEKYPDSDPRKMTNSEKDKPAAFKEPEWIPFKDIEWTGDIQAIHIDTRDFHSCVVKNKDSEDYRHPDLQTLCKYKDRFFHTEEEIKLLIDKYQNQSGGNKTWRHFMLDKIGGWALKYIRIYRTEYGWIICDRNKRAINKETLHSGIVEVWNQ